MPNQTIEDQRGPLTFTNAPTYEVNGVRYIDRGAAKILAARVAEEHADLLERLAQE
jgi:hypothetical protein